MLRLIGGRKVATEQEKRHVQHYCCSST